MDIKPDIALREVDVWLVGAVEYRHADDGGDDDEAS